MISTNIEQKLMMSQKYIVSTAFGTYFHQVSLCTSWHGGGGGGGGWVGYLGTRCEIPTTLGQDNLLQNKSDRGQNWQGDTKSIVECNDVLFVKVWGGDVSMARIKVEKYFFFMLACFY